MKWFYEQTDSDGFKDVKVALPQVQLLFGSSARTRIFWRFSPAVRPFGPPQGGNDLTVGSDFRDLPRLVGDVDVLRMYSVSPTTVLRESMGEHIHDDPSNSG
jgi:hypothetical protein